MFHNRMLKLSLFALVFVFALPVLGANHSPNDEGYQLIKNFARTNICFPRLKSREYQSLIKIVTSGEGFDLAHCEDCILLSHTAFGETNVVNKKTAMRSNGKPRSRLIEYEGNGSGVILSKNQKISLNYIRRSSYWIFYKQGIVRFVFTRKDNGEELILQNDS